MLIDINGIVERFKQANGFSTDKQVAGLLGLSQQDFGSRKQRGSILVPLLERALSLKINVQWLMSGEGESKINSSIEFQKESQELMIAITETVNETLDELHLTLPRGYKNKMIMGLHEYFLDDYNKENKAKDNVIRMEDFIKSRNSAMIASISTSARMTESK
jgi:hypothetical protein